MPQPVFGFILVCYPEGMQWCNASFLLLNVLLSQDKIQYLGPLSDVETNQLSRRSLHTLIVSLNPKTRKPFMGEGGY